MNSEYTNQSGHGMELEDQSDVFVEDKMSNSGV